MTGPRPYVAPTPDQARAVREMRALHQESIWGPKWAEAIRGGREMFHAIAQ